ncbi:MAG: division/cell wall cluster transcriptional repressor MraZ [Flavobacteriales bacterium]|jgi:MraZ protein|nr:MAG: division/cell wall cluster transcriptional repressor MraZ [Flavobacteriales bacterium]HRN40720.1 division/cell wall cluster transcriptional repressor MraZ [Vicingus sp.]MBE7441111.1 division/cell wall cluster transcriptional repressor MraZ [Flavobacteriales bacterium]MBV6484993.1 Transcriptional regulator MraZ [Flavobacteriales bacterium]MBX2959654.1 division/cell wall cluster transcriptional repressor MraZ [Flavobacteriales bacterium]
MANFIGEFDCKLDSKGRLMLPSGLRKQLDPAAQERFVLNRGFEKCLVLYPKNEWEHISAEVNKLNQYVKKNREFIRYFYRGASELELDNTGRILLPKRMLEYAAADKDVVLFAYSNRIEVWDKKTYEGLLTDEPDDFATLAEEVMGGNAQNNTGNELS